MRALFHDPALQKEFDEKGYVKVPFLSPEQVKELYDYYINQNDRVETYNPQYAEFSVLNAELECRKQIFQKITSVFLPIAEKIMVDTKPIIANFVCKEPGGLGQVPVHQNWAVIDEEKYTSVSIWCPLVDADGVNGTLEFIDGSHLYFRGPRGGYGQAPFLQVDEIIKQHLLKRIDAKAGEAIILDDSVIHYSNINQSDKIRLAIQLIMIPQESQPVHYVFTKDKGPNNVDVYHVDVDYYLGMNNWVGDLSKYKKAGTASMDKISYTPEMFFKAMKMEMPKGLKTTPAPAPLVQVTEQPEEGFAQKIVNKIKKLF